MGPLSASISVLGSQKWLMIQRGKMKLLYETRCSLRLPGYFPYLARLGRGLHGLLLVFDRRNLVVHGGQPALHVLQVGRLEQMTPVSEYTDGLVQSRVARTSREDGPLQEANIFVFFALLTIIEKIIKYK